MDPRTAAALIEDAWVALKRPGAYAAVERDRDLYGSCAESLEARDAYCLQVRWWLSESTGHMAQELCPAENRCQATELPPVVGATCVGRTADGLAPLEWERIWYAAHPRALFRALVRKHKTTRGRIWGEDFTWFATELGKVGVRMAPA